MSILFGGTEHKSMAFEERVDLLTFNMVSQGETDFGRLLSSLPGVYPTALLGSLKRLSLNGSISNGVVGRLFDQVSRPLRDEHSGSYVPGIPAAHPLDFDWRFDRSTTTALLRLCLKLSRPGDVIASIGCPSIFHLSLRHKFFRKFFLFDKNPAHSHVSNPPTHQFVLADLASDHVPRLEARVTIADPPWYRDYENLFIQAASTLTRVGGFIMTTTPLVGTKSGVEEDWELLIRLCGQIGIEYVGTLPKSVGYVSPYFERNSLRACGLESVPVGWRRANLAVFRKVANSRSFRKVILNDHGEWSEETYFGIRVKREPRLSKGHFKNPMLLSVVPGDVLPSVHRSDPRRLLADVWTEGNRIFACEGPFILLQILRALSQGRNVTEQVTLAIDKQLSSFEMDLVRSASHQVSSLVNVENTERRRFEC